MNEVNQIETVSAGEVCSLDVATQYGIDDIANNIYYKHEYSDIKTYNDAHDNKNNAHIYKLCETTNTADTKAAPLCVLEKEAGFGFTKTRNPRTLAYDSCITAECPTGFTENGNSCIKPRQNKTILMNGLVEERWYDWFMIPDYHLGNKYTRVDDVNYAPCEKDSIPSYGVDPVDNSPKYFNDTEDNLDKCVDKSQYFRGKYFNSETYCPLTWVYRAGATKKDLKHMYEDLIYDIENTERGNEYLDTLKRNVDNLIYDDIYKPVLDYGFKDYVGKSKCPGCEILQNDPEKKRKAKIICDTIKQLGKSQYIEKLMSENNEDEKIAKKKYGRAIQACHTVFCEDDNICFEEVSKRNLEREIMSEEKMKEGTPIVEAEKEKPKIAKKTIQTVLFIIVGVFLFIAGWFLYPIMKDILIYIRDVILWILGFCVDKRPPATGL